MIMPNPLRAKHEAEFAASAIHPDLWENFITLEDNKSILDYLLVGDLERTNTGRVAKTYLDKYAGLNSGWMVETEGSDFIQFKPDEPRIYTDPDGKEKSIKYESPPKFPTDIILLRHIPNWITGEKETPYWEFVKTADCPEVFIAEGAKKAASMLSVGLPTIALAGIFNTHTCKGGEPIPQLVEIIKNKKVVNLVFDSPDKLTQHPALENSYRKLKNLILEINPKCEVRIVCWQWWMGKGVDDAIAAGHLDKATLLKSAMPYYEALIYLNTNIPAYRRITGKRYIELADVDNFENKYSAMVVGKDGGKTTTNSKYLKSLSPSDKVLSITHRIKLGVQLAKVLALHYLNSKSNLSSEFQWKLILCINSLNIENVNPEDWKDAVIVLDEVVQLCDFIFSGTIKKAPEVMRNLSAILCAAKKVIIADADLDYKSLKLLDELMPGCDFLKHLKIYELEKNVEKIPMQVYKVSNKKVGAALYEEALAALIRGEKPLIMTDSQRPTSKLGAETLKRALEKGYQEATGKEIRGLALYAKATKNKGHEASRIVTQRIDIVYEYDFVVYTTVIGTGVSLDKDKLDEHPYFDRVIGGFSGAISINAILQGLHRYRRGVPRVVFIPNKGIAALHAGSSYSAKQNKYQTDKVKQDIQACYSAIISEVPYSDAVNLPLLNYHSKLRAIEKYECDNYFDLFCKRAEKDYVLTIDCESQSIVVPATLKETVEEVFEEYIETTVSAKVIESEERYEELKAKDVVLPKEAEDLEKTQIAKKYRIESHEALVNKTLIELDSNMGYHSGITNHYYMESYRLYYAEARGERNIKSEALDFEKYRKDPQKKVRLLLELGAQKLRESAGEKLHKFHPIVQKIIADYKRVDAIAPGIIYRHLHIALNEKDPMKMVDSLALKQGMTIHRDKKRKQLPNGERVSEASYTIKDSIRSEIFTIWDENNEIDMILNQRSEIRDTESRILEKIRSADVPDTEKEQLRIELSESGKLADALQEQLQQINEIRNQRKEDYSAYHQIMCTNLHVKELAVAAC